MVLVLPSFFSIYLYRFFFYM